MASHESVAEIFVKVVDPVCGIEILPEKAAGTQEYDSRTYYFAARTVWTNLWPAPPLA